METQIVEEGEVELEVPKLENYRTSPNEYVPSQTPVFYNPLMKVSRDISVSSLQVLGRGIDGLRVCDSLAGVGARGIRYAREIDGVGKVVINDRSSESVEFIIKNIERNELDNVSSSERDANSLLYNHRPRFHAIDLDPFGTPIPFLDSSFSAISRRGLFFVTATDTAPLCGAYPKACIRRYGARPLRTAYSREIGLRILIGSVQRRAAVYDLSLSPVLSHATQHFFRVHFQVSQGGERSNDILEEQGYLSHCFECNRRILTKGLLPDLPRECECGAELEHAGPLWLGDLADSNHLRETMEDLFERDFELEEKERALLRRCEGEVGGPPFFYDIHEISSQAGVSPPKLRRVLSEIRKRDYFASRTHFLDTGLRTGAPMDVLIEILSG